MHENMLLNVFNSNIDRLDKKIYILKEENSEIKKELIDLRESVQYHSDNVDEVNKKLEDIDKRVEEIKLDKITEDFVTKWEDRSPRNNLRFDGFQEESNETWEEDRDWRTHLNWKSTSHRVDTEKWWDKK